MTGDALGSRAAAGRRTANDRPLTPELAAPGNLNDARGAPNPLDDNRSISVHTLFCEHFEPQSIRV